MEVRQTFDAAAAAAAAAAVEIFRYYSIID
jgi:hypothetical protein